MYIRNVDWSLSQINGDVNVAILNIEYRGRIMSRCVPMSQSSVTSPLLAKFVTAVQSLYR